MPTTVFVVICLSLATASSSGDDELVETLRDAQTTHREAWFRGRARLLVEISRPKTEIPARIEGWIDWLDSTFVLKYKVSDPDGVFFENKGVGMDREWNYIAKGKDFVVRYFARTNTLSEWKTLRGTVTPIFELSPRNGVTSCCLPHARRPWRDLIGLTPATAEVFANSTFTYRRLPNGDVEQTRKDETGHWNTILFSAANDMYVTAVVQYDDLGKRVNNKVDYTYGRRGGRLESVVCVSQEPSRVPGEAITYTYHYTDLRLNGGVAAPEFTHDAVMARIRRETDYGKNRSPKSNHVADDAQLDSAAKELREKGTAKP